MMTYSLLDDPLFRARSADDAVEALTLPAVLHRLADADAPAITSFEALQAHQQQPWYQFLVQLGALCAARAMGGPVPASPKRWRTALLALADDNGAAWHLVVDDLAQPAFLQPPVPEGRLDGFKDDLPTPDTLDYLVASKNHDLKVARITQPRPAHWIYALITLQTLEGYSGRYNYGIARMNGGLGNRPLVGLSPALEWGRRFRRDVQVLLDARGSLAERYDLNGPALLWTIPWDGAKNSTLSLEALDPYFIEVCRRIRFTADEDGTLTCWRTSTKAARIDAPDDLNGITGDPWTPIDKGEAKALTLGGNGFTYQKLHQILLSGDYQKPPALEVRAGDDGLLYLVAQTLVRGQGKTEGLHHRIVAVPKKVATLFGRKTEREQLAARAQARIEQAGTVQSKVLYRAVGTLLNGGNPDDVDGDAVQPWLEAFDRAVDNAFFPKLWASVAMDPDEAAADWQRVLRDAAETQFHDAETRTPRTATRYWRARSTAQSIFWGTLREQLPKAFPNQASAPRTTEAPAT
ncbi:type I-E CRISPR-associated protein Cse1/CasA [Salisaeta longa]|uniref:type I-E CRISPR-associated protein Cse1/CasA n=1 Tax=Salisaeta longa TaxID=503170 RepID=UPI0003B43876|nr:type I-E CRISPR-associated protein Cse1/CasA [Salisaeta longa]